MRSLFLFVTGAVLLAVGLALAAPETISYQGRLTDSGGVPYADGAYSITFTLYDATTGGSSIWSETQSVTTTDGLFSVLLGSVSSFGYSTFATSNLYLAMAVGANPELTPRIPLSSTPYAFRTATIDGAVGGTIAGGVVASIPGAGSATLSPVSGYGSVLHLTEETGDVHAAIEPDVGGTGGYFRISNGNGGSALVVDGNYDEGGNAFVAIYGAGSSTHFYPGESGDAAVVLPEDAIHSVEMINEPGIAGNNYSGQVTLTTSMQDLITVDITIPAPGYVVLNGQVGHFTLAGTTGQNWWWLQIDKTEGGGAVSHYATNGGAYTFPNTSYFFYAGHAQRVYYEPAAGTYTYRLEAQKAGTGAGGTASAYSPTLTAAYYPTSYGSVVTTVSSSEVTSFESATPVLTTELTREGPLASPAGNTDMYQVDLRELELKVARERAELEAAQRALAEARLQKQRKACESHTPAPQDQ